MITLDENEVREDLWLNHGHGYNALYGDDGEMQCAKCGLDFKRMELSLIRWRLALNDHT